MNTLNLFYENPDPDRWLPYDRFPRRIVRRLVRGRARVGGQERVFLNLCKGLDEMGAAYRVNDYRFARAHPREVVGIVGKPQVLDRIEWRNPILFGASVFSHPLQDPHLLERRPIKRILLPGEWMRAMWEPSYGSTVVSWPVGIDTAEWSPPPQPPGPKGEILLYDKVRWEHERYELELIGPVRAALRARGLTVCEMRYGSYEEADFRSALARCAGMIFLCEHETQGIAYQQALACGVPILAWDRGGMWQDPEFYPGRVRFEPVSSVPYWDERCGVKFRSVADFAAALETFLQGVKMEAFAPRDYVLEHLTLAHCARQYVEHYRAVENGSAR